MSILRKVAAILLVPVIAVLPLYLLDFLKHYLIAPSGTLALHDDYYVVLNTEFYFISLYALGFVPALLLRKFTGTLLAAVTPAIAITMYQFLHLYLKDFLDLASIISILFYYPFNWFIALLVSLIIWGTQERKGKA